MTWKIAISGMNAVDNPGPGVGVARSLKQALGSDVSIIGLAYGALEPGIYMDWLVDQAYTMPYPSGNSEVYLDRLREIREASGVDFIIPCLDAELPLYIRYADEIASLGIRTFLPTMNQFRLRSKDQLGELARLCDVKLPKTMVVTSEQELAEAMQELAYPVFIKGIFYEAKKANTYLEAVSHFRTLAAVWGFPILVQEVIQGEELNLVGVGDGEGNSLGSVAVKKLYVTNQGKMWSGVTVRNPQLSQAAEQLMKSVRWRGPYELECIVHNDEIYLIEINPRFPAWTYFATAVGTNLPYRLFQHVQQETIEPATECEAGKVFLRYSYEMVTDLASLQGVLAMGERTSAPGKLQPN